MTFCDLLQEEPVGLLRVFRGEKAHMLVLDWPLLKISTLCHVERASTRLTSTQSCLCFVELLATPC